MATSSSSASIIIPVAAVLSHPLEDGEIAIISSSGTSVRVPGAALLCQPLQRLKLSILGCYSAYSFTKIKTVPQRTPNG
jgi:RNase P/RNase MRP subunit p29